MNKIGRHVLKSFKSNELKAFKVPKIKASHDYDHFETAPGQQEVPEDNFSSRPSADSMIDLGSIMALVHAFNIAFSQLFSFTGNRYLIFRTSCPNVKP